METKNQIDEVIRRLGQDIRAVDIEEPESFGISDVVSNIKVWLQPMSVIEHEMYLDSDHYLTGTCRWLQNNAAFRGWLESLKLNHN